MLDLRRFLHALAALCFFAFGHPSGRRMRSCCEAALRFDPFTLCVASAIRFPRASSVTRLAPVPAAPGGGMGPKHSGRLEIARERSDEYVAASGTAYATACLGAAVPVERRA